MRTHNSHRQATTLYAWNDNLWILFLCMTTCVALLATLTLAKKTDAKIEDSHPAGAISVYVFWKDGLDADMDTHIKGPDGEHIFYSHTSGRNWNLLRDDLGKSEDNDKNFENAYSRGALRGEYIINIHAYRATKEMFPIDVSVEVNISNDSAQGKGSATVLKQTVTLYKVKQEVTAIRFSLDSEGKIVDGSVNRVFKSIVKQD